MFHARTRRCLRLAALAAGLAVAVPAVAGDPVPLAFYPIEPCRIFDTRTGTQGGSLAIETLQPFPSCTRMYTVRTHCQIPAEAQAIAYNLTIVRQGAYAGHVTLFPADPADPTMTVPPTSNLNFAPNQVVANGGIVALGTAPFMGAQLVMGGAPLGATADLIFDVTGYFAP